MGPARSGVPINGSWSVGGDLEPRLELESCGPNFVVQFAKPALVLLLGCMGFLTSFLFIEASLLPDPMRESSDLAWPRLLPRE